MASLSDITVAISTNISNFQKGLDRAQRKLQKAGKGFKEAGTTMSQSLTLPLAAAGAGAVKAASDFEDAVAEIRKVSDQETASKLAGQIRQMATEIPLAQSEIANLAADAARFGVSGTKNIQQFTKTVAQMSFTTDLSAQEAGRSLAKIADQTDTPISEIDRLGSTIVKLGDNMATSQNEIVKAMSRGAIAARNFGLSGQEIAGLSARINEVSESSERAGTRLRRVFQELANPKTVQKVAQNLGMTSSEFKALKNNSPAKAIQAVVQQISRGGQAGKEMANIFATSSRAALRGLASDTQALNQALGMARNEFKANGELSRQAAIQQAKFGNQLQLALNRLRNVAITIGNKLMPFVLDLVNAIQRGISSFTSLSSRMQDIIIVGAGIAAALGPVLFIFGFFVSSVLPGLISALSVASSAFAALLGPVGAIAAAIAAGATLIIANWEQVKAAFVNSGLAKLVKTIGSKIKDGVQIIIGAIKFLFNQLNMTSDEGKNAFQAILKRLFTIAKSIMSAFFSVLKTVFSAVAPLITNVTVAFEKFATFMTNIFSDPEKALKALGDIFKQVFAGVLNVLESVINGIFDFVQSLAGVIPGVSSAMESAKSAVTDAKKGIVDALDLKEQQKNINNTKDALTGLASKFKDLGTLPSLPSLGGGGGGGKSGGGDSSLSKVTDEGGGGTGPSKAKTVPEGALENVKGYATLQRKAAQSTKKLNKEMARQAERQRRNAVINQQAGQIIGRTMKRTTQQLTKTFSAALVGTQSLSKGMAAFGDFMQKMFQKLIQKVIQLIIKMTILKALQTAIGGGLGGGIGGGAIGGVMKGLTGGMSGMFGGGGSGGGGSMNISGSLKGDDINLAGQRAQGASNRINGAGIN
jgi:TP901 family phage tail tape measure protein